MVSFIRSLEQENSPILEEIESEALKDKVPIIRKEMGKYAGGGRRDGPG